MQQEGMIVTIRPIGTHLHAFAHGIELCMIFRLQQPSKLLLLNENIPNLINSAAWRPLITEESNMLVSSSSY